MDNESLLQVEMLGGCSLSCGGRCVRDTDYRSKKAWVLLEYLILYRSREISQEELIELLYGGDGGSNPAGALKTLVYRIRSMLDTLGSADSRDMILVTRTGYAWNTALPMTVDVDLFEGACQQAASPWAAPDEKLAACRRAMALYKGDLLPRSAGEEWTSSLTGYYHSMYLNMAKTAVELLEARKQWPEVIAACEQAIAVDGYEEFFHYHMIRALVRTGETQRALEQYKRMYALFYTELGVTPSADLTALYRDIIRTTRHPASDLQSIRRFLQEEDAMAGAFFCELEVFKDIYHLEARSAARSGRSVFLALLSLSARDEKAPSLKLLNSYMDKLAACIQSSLRRGDVAAKFSISQFVLLLPTSSAANGAIALERIAGQFAERYPRCPLELTWDIEPMEIMD